MSRSAASKLVYAPLNSVRDTHSLDIFKSRTRGMVDVHDPYRWLEHDSSQTSDWIHQQTRTYEQYAQQHYTHISNTIGEQLTRRWNYERVSCPFKRGNQYFFMHNSGLQNQSVLYAKQTLDEDKRVVLDPNVWSSDGTVALGNIEFSQDGRYLAYSVSKSGSDWNTIKVKDVVEMKDLTDVVDWVKFSSIAWLHSNEGFFYSRYPMPKKFENVESDSVDKGTEVEKVANQMVYFHRLGTDQSEDVLIYSDPNNPEWMFGVEVSDCGNYLLISVSESCEPVNRVYYSDITTLLEKKEAEKAQAFVKVIDNFEAEYSYITNESKRFWFKTNRNAPNYKIICLDLDNPNPDYFRDIIPASHKSLMNHAICVDSDKLIVSYLEDVKESLRIYSLEGEFVKSALDPSILTVTGLSGKKSQSELFFSVSSFTTPGTIYQMDLKNKEISKNVFLQIKIDGLNSEDYVEKQAFYESRDGTKVPMFIVHRKGITLNGANPTLLYGYGGFNISLTPSFSVYRWTWMDLFNGVFAMPNLRGGGEFGQVWHHSGIKLKKQNVFDDFHAAAEYLIKEKYTSPQKLAIQGGSNGGLLIGACLNQRPDLYACGIPQVGVLDMLRFHKFTIGHAWCSDYGNAETNAEEFDALYAYSPVHNIPKCNSENLESQKFENFPAVLITTADHDDRVVPLHSFKYAATLQYELGESAKNPLLIRIETKAGHGAGKPLSKTISEYAEIMGFIAHILKAELK